MWTYEDCFGYNSGYVDIYASNREEAEKIFYEINRPFIIRVENGEPIYNPEGGFFCECVLTYEEWLSEGSPQDLGVKGLKLNMLDKFI